MRRKEANAGRRLRTGVLVFSICLSATGIGLADEDLPEMELPTEFRATFDEPGPLPGTLPGDPWEIKNGLWTVTDAALTDGNPLSAANRVLVQGSKGITPNEPMVFARDLPFREVTAEVTAAYMDSTDGLGGLPVGASVGLVFRAPIDAGKADSKNLYLFSSFVSGVTRQYPTGRALGIFKRVALGYYLLDTAVVHTWANLTQPHRYKVVMGNGTIKAYFDNRLVISHTDLPSGDKRTDMDPLPGLPFDQGAVGLRTSGTRAWFDDFVVVGNDAYEGRAGLFDLYTQVGEASNIRRGDSITVSNTLQNNQVDRLETGFTYGNRDTFGEEAINTLENPFSEGSDFGLTARAQRRGDTAVSTVRLGGGDLLLREPLNGSITVSLTGKLVEMRALASCTERSSALTFVATNLLIEILDDPQLPDMIIGPFPLAATYPPNSVIFERPGVISVVGHPQTITTAPSRVESAALRISIPEGGGASTQPGNIPVPGVTTVRVPGLGSPTPPVELTIAPVTAGRYCA